MPANARNAVAVRAAIFRSLAAVVAVAAALAVAGCGSSSGSGGSSGSGSSSGSAPASSGGGAITTAPSTLKVGWAQQIATLDPDTSVETQDLAVLHLIGGYLYAMNATGGVYPSLAQSVTTAHHDTLWTFHLRPNLKFSNGAPLTASDVAATYNHAKADKANLVLNFFDPITAFDAPNPTTVVMHTSRPYPSLLKVLAEPEFAVFPASALSHFKTLVQAPVSAGRYMLQSWGGSTTAVLVANPHYWGPAPPVHTLDFITVPDEVTRFDEVRSGEIDFDADLPPSLLPQVSKPIVGTTVPFFGFNTLSLDDAKAPFNQVGVRRAASLAIDRKQLVEDIFLGHNTPVASFWPSTMDGYDPAGTTQDVAAARSALKASSCKLPCAATLTYSSQINSWQQQAATVIAANLDAAGFKITLNSVDSTTFNQAQSAGTFQILLDGLYDYANVPDGMLDYGFELNTGYNVNFTHFAGAAAEITRLSNAAITATGAGRASALQAINTYFTANQPFVTLFDYQTTVASRYASSVISMGPGGFINVGNL